MYCVAALFYIFLTILPSPLFNSPLSTVILDRNGNLLGAQIAKDGQWRFPVNENVPEKYKTALLTFEDRRFQYHQGFDLISIFRALWLNLKTGKVVSGGSTITMQVIRLQRKETSRSVLEKIIETILAFRLEMTYSKREILGLYASNAPYGGNVVGLEAASWRYFGRNPKDLTWAEAAMLAVLPNSPSLIHLGKNRERLEKKRNRLLKKLFDKNKIDEETYELAIYEPIPENPFPFPQYAPHLLERLKKSIKSTNFITTTIDFQLQEQVNHIIEKHYEKLHRNNVNNIAIFVINNKYNEVVAYVGNKYKAEDKSNGNQVDIITSYRSTGSILKPFLYAAMLTSGQILPNSLVPDIPTQIGGFMPENFNLGFDGAVPAKRALARSLNVPSVKLLQKFGQDKFHYLLKKIGINSLTKPADHYGLSIILGGCEASLWEIASIYSSMAQILTNYGNGKTSYSAEDYHTPKLILTKNSNTKNTFAFGNEKFGLISVASIWLTFHALLDVERPEETGGWAEFESSQKIAWKTGTSFGFRDAWAIGVTPDYTVAVWVGNADGEGRPGVVGVKAAAPALFDVFKILPPSQNWFAQPFDEMVQLPLCKKSGFLAGENCEEIDSQWVQESASRSEVCPYHKLIHLDKSEKFQVTSDCESVENMIHRKWFVLPPAMELYYKNRNSNYITLPPMRDDCRKKQSGTLTNSMEVIYPHTFTKIFVPVELDGTLGSAVFEIAHRKAETTIFWHLDNQFIGQTKNFHKMPIKPSAGYHVLTLIDQYGEKLEITFEAIGKKK